MTKDSLDLAAMVDSWQLALSAERKSEHTVRNYTSGVRRFLRWCDSTGTEPVLDKTTVQTFITALLDSGVRPQVPVRAVGVAQVRGMAAR